MANLVPCKSCKHEVSKSAKSCPNCGESSPGVNSKDHLIGCLGIIVLLVVFIGLVESCSNDESEKDQLSEQVGSTSQTAVPEIPSQDSKKTDSDTPEFDITINQFADRFSQSMSALGLSGNFQISGESTQNNVLSGTLVGDSENIGVSIFATPETKALQSAIFIGTGDGSQESGIEVTFGAVALVMAIENPDMPQEERKNILKNLGLLNGEIFEVDKLSFERVGVKYTAMYSDVTGLLVTADKKP